MMTLVFSALGIVAVCVISRFLIAMLNLHVQHRDNPEQGVSWRFPLHGALYIAAGLATVFAVSHIQYWYIGAAISVVLVIVATFKPTVDWSHDPKVKRVAYCANNYAYGAITGVLISVILNNG